MMAVFTKHTTERVGVRCVVVIVRSVRDEGVRDNERSGWWEEVRE